MKTAVHIESMLLARLPAPATDWYDKARSEIAGGLAHARFCALISQASRHAPRGALAPNAGALTRAAELLEGWNPERWSVLDTLRASLLLAREDLAEQGAVEALEEAFRYAEVGELVALYRSLAHLPAPQRFAWRAGEGARSSMRVVFEAACCDTPFPYRWFDDLAWRQAVIKALFVEAPLWRVWNLDRRLDAELARMALDLADERRSAGRPVNPELWMCLGTHAGARGLAALERELAHGAARGRAGAASAQARAGERERLLSLSAVEADPTVHQAMSSAAAGKHDQRAFAALEANTQGTP
jgi:hypothetical protein